MANDWILDVLTDLKTFAARNGLPSTERQLDQLTVTAAREMASMQGIAQVAARQGIGHAGDIHRGSAEGPNS